MSLRSAFAWILVALLVTAAASYAHGSRYALVGHGPFQTAGAQAGPLASGAQPDSRSVSQEAGQQPVEAGPAQATPAGPADHTEPGFNPVHVVHHAGPCVDPDALERDCCERRQAPRSQPALLRTGAVEPPAELQRQPGDDVLSTIFPPEPELPALTVVQLSVSRT